MRSKLLAAALLLAALSLSPAAVTAAPKGEHKAHVSGAPADDAKAAEAKAIEQAYPWEKTLTKRTGVIDISEANAKLDMGEGYYFLGPEDSRKVIVDGWGNPPDQASGILGMVFPKGMSPMQRGSWGAVVTWQPTGYVNDKDARTADYGKILDQLREGEKADNDARVKAGFKAIHVVGWAEQPGYDSGHHVVVWARQLESDGMQGLNYDLRLLGRKGVLSLNIVGSMENLADIRTAAQGVRDTALFNTGDRYADFKPGIDKTAGYGIAGLVAAGVGIAAVKKIGLIGVILLFAKKGIVVIIAFFGAIAAWFRKLFNGGKDPKAKPGVIDNSAPPMGGSTLDLGSGPADPPLSPPPPPPPPPPSDNIVS